MKRSKSQMNNCVDAKNWYEEGVQKLSDIFRLKIGTLMNVKVEGGFGFKFSI